MAVARPRKRRKGQKRRKPKRRKPGPKSLREKAVHPTRPGRKARKAMRINAFRSNESMKAYRKGYNAAYRVCGKYMKRIGCKEPGKFDQNNVHQGKLWALPVECRLTGKQAELILEKCYEAGLSEPQLRQVKKSLSYAHFLTTGKPGLNYPEVKTMWETFGDFEPVKKSIKPQKIPTPENLREAFTTPWNEACGMSLMQWTVALLISWDWAVAGARSQEDLKRIKNSTDHDVNHADGYGSTGYVEGRSKLCGRKRGTRPWRVWRLCLCPGGKHQPVPAVFRHRINNEGNPTKQPTWCTNCPVCCMELVMLKQAKEPRMYPKWLNSKRAGGRFSVSNVGNCSKRANEWFRCQGVTDEDYCSNAGRKSLAEWLSKVQAVYEVGFEIHGDLWEVWGKDYQDDSENPTGFKRRTQSSDPKRCLAAYKKLRKYFGVADDQAALSRMEKLMMLTLKSLGKNKEALKIVKESF